VRRVDITAVAFAGPGRYRGMGRYRGDSAHVAHNPEVTETQARATSGHGYAGVGCRQARRLIGSRCGRRCGIGCCAGAGTAATEW
jgi:hypothetical protein